MSKTELARTARRTIEQISEQIVHVRYDIGTDGRARSALIAGTLVRAAEPISPSFTATDTGVSFQNASGDIVLREVGHALEPKEVFKYRIDGDPVIRQKHTANGDVAYIANARQESGGFAFHGRITFRVSGDHPLYGLGQSDNGIYDYRGQREYLFQTNMKIAIPFLLSCANYGLLIDTETALVFSEQDGEMRFELETVAGLSYYVITGDCFDDIIASLRMLTGTAPMLPRWAFGYLQSKERYRSSRELLDTAAKFRAMGIPADCLIQDWYTWKDGLWGEKQADPERFPDVLALTDALHREHLKLMVSIWPNMAPGGTNYREFQQARLLLPNSFVYDAYQETARALYWKQCEAGWFDRGIDGWWCDNSEPFSDTDWCGETKNPDHLRYQRVVADSQNSMDWTRINAYGLYHAKGIYENWRRRTGAKRVMNLTRSTYLSGQKYGVVAWSGDISAKWPVLKNQITEGIKFCMSGAPYWTLDIGGFFTVKDKYENRGCEQAGNPSPLWFWDGDYNDGVLGPGYRELYVRWLQYAVFLPLFRAHGTDTPREPWNFGEPGEMFYDTILSFIRLRYRLLPYVYASAASVTFRQDTLLRSLMFDFPQDENVRHISNSYMFGRAFLVCPVTQPMYYGPGGAALPDTDKTWPVYLPKAVLWYDYWTQKAYPGGQTVVCDAPLQRIPLFVRAGSILPLSGPLTYADERNGAVAEIMVFDGADGEFTLYNDEGDGYGYESGMYSMIPLRYRCAGQTLTFCKTLGSFPYQTCFTLRLVTDGQIRSAVTVQYQGDELSVCLQ